MNITLLTLLPTAVFLLLTAFLFYRLDGRLLRQSAVVVGRLAVVLLVLGAALHYVFLWNRAWLTLLWVVLTGGVAAAAYCRRRWLAVPVVAGSLPVSLVTGVAVVALTGRGRLLDAWLLVPVMSVLMADALFVCRRGLSTYAMERRVHQSLDEYMQGNGASLREARRPFAVSAVRRAFAPVLSQLLLVGVVFVPSMLCGLFIGGVEPWLAVGFIALLTAAALCSSLAALLLTLYIYERLKQTPKI